MISPLEIQQAEDQDVNLLQTNVKNFVKVLEDNPLLDGHLLENIELDAGDNAINHRLGRRLRGWIVTRLYDPTVAGAGMTVPYIYDKQDTNDDEDKYLILTAVEEYKISLWVF